MTSHKVTRNVYCTDPEDRVVPNRCRCCNGCWLFVAGRKKGICVFGGPYGGYERVVTMDDEKE